MTSLELGFPFVTDARDPSTGLPVRRPSDGLPSRSGFGDDPRARESELGVRGPFEPSRGADLPPRGAEMPPRGADLPPRDVEVPPRGADLPPRGVEMPPRGADRGEAFPVRQPTMRPPRPSGRHRRPVPASLPQSAPALVLGVPGRDTDLSAGPAAELAAVLRVDNPAVEVRAARIDGGGPDDPTDLRSVLADAAARRPDGGPTPCAVVIPLIATVNPPVIRRLRESVAASGTNAIVGGFINSNAMIAEVLHIRLAEAGLARADRVRLFSIVTAADGVLIATVGGPDAAAMANVTSVLLAARLALPVITASIDSAPSIHEGAMRLKEMGVSRLAVAPCFIGPEATRRDLDTLHALGADYAKPIGAHSNIAKLAALTYGQAISQLDLPHPGGEEVHGAHE
jgi:hypothetical protein